MHDLQTILKMNAPLNLRSPPGLAKAYEIGRESLAIPPEDVVVYGNNESRSQQ